MGREIRRVPKDWTHPTYNSKHYFSNMDPSDHKYGRYHPLYDDDYDKASEKWIENFLLWQKKEHPDQLTSYGRTYKYYWEYTGNPPEKEYYRNEEYETQFNGPVDHFQIYETVSEGTPVSPKFGTLKEMVEWLVEQGHDRGIAEAFADIGSAPSMVIIPGKGVLKDIDSLRRL